MRNVLLVVGIVLTGILSAGAQENAVASKKKDALKEQGEKIQKDEDASGNADMIRMKAAEVPNVLRKALQAAQYKGWDAETSTIYGSEQKDLFVVEIHEGKQAKTFYFDGEGQPIMD